MLFHSDSKIAERKSAAVDPAEIASRIVAMASRQRRQRTQAAGAGREHAAASRSVPATDPLKPAAPSETRSEELLLLRAMIAAAFADGRLDDREQERITAQFARFGGSSDDTALMLAELANPLDIQQLTEQLTSREMAIKVYTASLIATDGSNPAGQLYLRRLALALSIPDDLVVSLYEQAALAQGYT